MEEEEQIKLRFSEELKALGVPKSTIAQTVGFSAQTFTNVTSGRNLPGVLLLNKLQKFFPTFDSYYVINGVRSGDESETVKSLKRDLAREKAIANALLAKPKGATICPDVDKKLRRSGYNQVMQLARRQSRRVVFTPGRVQESPYAALIAGVRDRVRMQ